MLIVDKALERRCASDDPVRVGLVGAGYSGRNVAHQIVHSFPGLRLVAIANRTVDTAEAIYRACGLDQVSYVDGPSQLEETVSNGGYAVTDNVEALCQAAGIDAIIEATGTIEFGARTIMKAIEGGKHVILLNAELDATLGPILKMYADRAGVVYSNSDGDEPGVAMNMYRFVKSIGLKPVVAGNLKGLYDPYRNPDTQQGFAKTHNQKPTTMTSFADGTKLSMELGVLSNSTGFGVGKRGMHGPQLAHVRDSTEFFRSKLADEGMVDFLIGAEPGNGAFVLGLTEDAVKQEYLRYLKMGDGPLYAFYTPFHLPQLEVPLTVARAVLFNDAAVSPEAGHVSDVVAVAKKDLNAGEVLDGIGGFCCYSLLERSDVSVRERLLPMGVSDGCRLRRDVSKDQAVTYDDVELPPGRFCDELREEIKAHFHSSALSH